MRKVAKLPRILKINQIDGLTISVVFNNGESREIDFREVLKSIDLPRDSNARILLDPKEFKKVKLNNNNLSWKKAGQIITFKGKKRSVPFEIGPDVLYQFSKKDKEASVLAIGQLVREMRAERVSIKEWNKPELYLPDRK